VAMLTRAYELSDRLTERERLLSVASYHMTVSGERDRALAAYEQIVALYPDELAAMNNMAAILSDRGESERAAAIYQRILQQDSLRRVTRTNLVVALNSAGRFDEAQAQVDALRRHFPDDPDNERFAALLALGRGDMDGARQSSTRFSGSARGAMSRALGLGSVGIVEGIGGRTSRALAAVEQMLEVLHQSGSHQAAYDIGFATALVRMEHWGEDQAAVTRDVEEYLRRHRPDQLPPAEQSLQALAPFMAATGQRARAKALRDRFEREVVTPSGMRSDQMELQVLDARLMVYDGRAAEAARQLRRAQESENCDRCLLPLIAWAYDNAAMPDSALAYYERYLERPASLNPADFVWRTRAILRAAELNEGAGRMEQARYHYAVLLNLWSDADPLLRPKVESIRSRLAALTER
jgi:tetratricopeptide (TPR) repeat protein